MSSAILITEHTDLACGGSMSFDRVKANFLIEVKTKVLIKVRVLL